MDFDDKPDETTNVNHTHFKIQSRKDCAAAH
jgi:hypothetical protein